MNVKSTVGRQLWLWFVAALMQAVSLAAAQAQTGGSPVELSDLVRSAMPPQGGTKALPWNQLDGTGVRWNSAGPVAAPPPKVGGPLWRVGSVVLRDGGKPLYQAAKGKPGRWRVQASGGPDGVASLWLSTADDVESGVPDLEALKTHGFAVRVRCKNDLGTSMSLKGYALSLPQKAPLTVMFEVGYLRDGRPLFGITAAYSTQAVAASTCG